MSISQGNARLVLSQQQWEQLPNCLADPFFARIARTNRSAIDLLEQAMAWRATHAGAAQCPPHPDERVTALARQHVTRTIKAHLMRSAVEWYLTRDPAYLAKAKSTIAILLDPNSWQPAIAHYQYELAIAEQLHMAAFALDVLGAYLEPAESQGLVRNIIDIGLARYVKGIEAEEWFRHADFNWNAATHGSAGFAALAIEPLEPALAANILARVRDGLPYLLEAFPSGGGWTEGMMYLATTIGHLTDFVAALHRLTGDDLGLSTKPEFIDTLNFRLQMFGGDDKPLNFSNVDAESYECVSPHTYWWARRCGRPEWAAFEDNHVKPWDTTGLFYDIEAFWYRTPNQQAEAIPPKPLSHFRGLDWLTFHGPRTWLAFRSGNNGGNHNNLDLGHFILGRDDERFLVDPGYMASQTQQHNTAVLRSLSQANDAVAHIFRVRELPNGFYLACDLSAVSPHRTAYYHRHLLLLNDAHLLVIDDAMGREGKRPSMSIHLQTQFPHESNDDTVFLKGPKSKLTIQLLTGHSAVSSQRWEWRSRSYTGLAWQANPDRAHTRHAMLLSFADAHATFKLDADVATLTLNGESHSIDLAEGSLLFSSEAAI